MSGEAMKGATNKALNCKSKRSWWKTHFIFNHAEEPNFLFRLSVTFR